MTCRCSEFEPPKLSRGGIVDRIREGKLLKKTLHLVARDTQEQDGLWKCPICGQLWQSSCKGDYRKRECFFQVPPVELEEWRREPFADPAALFNFVHAMRSFVEASRGAETERACGSAGCARHALSGCKFCLIHHMEMLRKAKLPFAPRGRLLEPYQAIINALIY